MEDIEDEAFLLLSKLMTSPSPARKALSGSPKQPATPPTPRHLAQFVIGESSTSSPGCSPSLFDSPSVCNSSPDLKLEVSEDHNDQHMPDMLIDSHPLENNSTDDDAHSQHHPGTTHETTAISLDERRREGAARSPEEKACEGSERTERCDFGSGAHFSSDTHVETIDACSSSSLTCGPGPSLLGETQAVERLSAFVNLDSHDEAAATRANGNKGASGPAQSQKSQIGIESSKNTLADADVDHDPTNDDSPRLDEVNEATMNALGSKKPLQPFPSFLSTQTRKGDGNNDTNKSAVAQRVSTRLSKVHESSGKGDGKNDANKTAVAQRVSARLSEVHDSPDSTTPSLSPLQSFLSSLPTHDSDDDQIDRSINVAVEERVSSTKISAVRPNRMTKRGRPVVLLDTRGSVVKEFASQSAAVKELSLLSSTLSNCVNRKTEHVAGQIFRWKDEVILDPLPTSTPVVASRVNEENDESFSSDKNASIESSQHSSKGEPAEVAESLECNGQAASKSQSSLRSFPSSLPTLNGDGDQEHHRNNPAVEERVSSRQHNDDKTKVSSVRSNRTTNHGRPIVLLDTRGSVLKEFESQGAAVKELSLSSAAVSRCVNRKIDNVAGHVFRWKDEVILDPLPASTPAVASHVSEGTDESFSSDKNASIEKDSLPSSQLSSKGGAAKVAESLECNGQAASSAKSSSASESRQSSLQSFPSSLPTLDGNGEQKHRRINPAVETRISSRQHNDERTKISAVRPKRMTNHGRPIVLLDTRGSVVKEFESQGAAVKELSLSSAAVSKCVNRKIDNVAGQIFRWKDEVILDPLPASTPVTTSRVSERSDERCSSRKNVRIENESLPSSQLSSKGEPAEVASEVADSSGTPSECDGQSAAACQNHVVSRPRSQEGQQLTTLVDHSLSSSVKEIAGVENQDLGDKTCHRQPDCSVSPEHIVTGISPASASSTEVMKISRKPHSSNEISSQNSVRPKGKGKAKATSAIQLLPSSDEQEQIWHAAAISSAALGPSKADGHSYSSLSSQQCDKKLATKEKNSRTDQHILGRQHLFSIDEEAMGMSEDDIDLDPVCVAPSSSWVGLSTQEPLAAPSRDPTLSLEQHVLIRQAIRSQGALGSLHRMSMSHVLKQLDISPQMASETSTEEGLSSSSSRSSSSSSSSGSSSSSSSATLSSVLSESICSALLDHIIAQKCEQVKNRLATSDATTTATSTAPPFQTSADAPTFAPLRINRARSPVFSAVSQMSAAVSEPIDDAAAKILSPNPTRQEFAEFATPCGSPSPARELASEATSVIHACAGMGETGSLTRAIVSSFHAHQQAERARRRARLNLIKRLANSVSVAADRGNAGRVTGTSRIEEQAPQHTRLPKGATKAMVRRLARQGGGRRPEWEIPLEVRARARQRGYGRGFHYHGHGVPPAPAPYRPPLPPAPKKKRDVPKSAYMNFQSCFCKVVCAQHPEMKFGEVNKEVARRWHLLSADEKANFKDPEKGKVFAAAFQAKSGIDLNKVPEPQQRRAAQVARKRGFSEAKTTPSEHSDTSDDDDDGKFEGDSEPEEDEQSDEDADEEDDDIGDFESLGGKKVSSGNTNVSSDMQKKNGKRKKSASSIKMKSVKKSKGNKAGINEMDDGPDALRGSLEKEGWRCGVGISLNGLGDDGTPSDQPHQWIGKLVRRFFTQRGELKKQNGKLIAWMPANDEVEDEPALWRMIHEDGDVEDLEEQEVREAIEAYESDLVQPQPEQPDEMEDPDLSSAKSNRKGLSRSTHKKQKHADSEMGKSNDAFDDLRHRLTKELWHCGVGIALNGLKDRVCPSTQPHEWVGRMVRRFYNGRKGEIKKQDGKLIAWMPSNDEEEDEPALWRMMHRDGDQEDLEEGECLKAMEAYDEDLKEPNEDDEEGARGGGGGGGGGDDDDDDDDDDDLPFEWQQLPKEIKDRVMQVAWVKFSAKEPWWPGLVYLPDGVEGDLLEKTMKTIGTKHLVYFYGSRDWGHVDFANVKPFGEEGAESKPPAETVASAARLKKQTPGRALCLDRGIKIARKEASLKNKYLRAAWLVDPKKKEPKV